jgi:C4-dicarboxylate-specific signal transduction histidine kinase
LNNKINSARSLQSEIRNGQFIVIMAILITCGLGLAVSNWAISSKTTIQIGKATAHILTRNLIAPILFKDQNEIKKTLSSLSDHPTFSSAILLDHSNQLVGMFPEGPMNAPFKASDYDSSYHFPILDNGEDLGTLVLVQREDLYNQEITQLILIVPAMLILATIISFFISRATRDKINNQILEILKTTQDIRQNSDYSLRVPNDKAVGGKIVEFQTLADDFNAMLSTVEQRDREIASMNANLEQTVEKRTEELKEVQLNLIQSSRLSALGEMAAGVAHEINNPLAIIKTKSAQLQELLVENPIDQELAVTMAASVVKTTERIAKIVQGLKSFSRDGSSDPFDVINVHALLTETIDFCNERLKSKGIDLRVDGFDHNLQFAGSTTQISQVLLNLLNNSSDAIEKLNEKWIHVSTEHSDKEIMISVTDSGPGIPEAIRKKLMQPFFTTKDVGKGTGLGLSISRNIIKKHNGTFDIDANSKNTRFVIRLPLTQIS